MRRKDIVPMRIVRPSDPKLISYMTEMQ